MYSEGKMAHEGAITITNIQRTKVHARRVSINCRYSACFGHNMKSQMRGPGIRSLQTNILNFGGDMTGLSGCLIQPQDQLSLKQLSF